MRRTVLPFPEPRVPDGQPGQRPLGDREAATRATGAKLFRRYGRTSSPTLRLSPLGLFAGVLQGANPARTSALAVGPRLRHSGSATDKIGRLRSLGLHGGPDLRQATGMGTRSFHDVTAAYPLPGPCPRSSPSPVGRLGQRFRSTEPGSRMFPKKGKKRRAGCCPPRPTASSTD